MIVIGGGNMARAILTRALDQGQIEPGSLTVVEPDTEKRAFFESLGAKGLASVDAIRDRLTPDVALMLAIKPQVLPQIEKSLAESRFSGLVISILAGTTSDRVRSALGGGCGVVRVMPNTPAQIGMGVSAICVGAGAGERDFLVAKAIFEGVGDVVRVDESLMDAVTAVSGSGPAYVFLLAQAMIEGAIGVGLDAVTARRLVLGTIRGGAEMLVRTEDTPEELRRAVTSPKGTTEAAIGVMEEAGLRGIVARGVRAARDRGRQLGRS